MEEESVKSDEQKAPTETSSRPRLENVWNKERIQQQIDYYQGLLEGDEMSKSRHRRIVTRIGHLKKGLDGKRQIGGQLKKKAKNEYHIKKGHTRNPDAHHTCLRCRQVGHRLVNCPMNSSSSETGGTEDSGKEFGITGICFNCGKSGHRLKNCPKPTSRDNLPFAQCFLCGDTGHIVAHCSRNNSGIFPRGGGCFYCGKTDHRKFDCPEAKQKKETVPKQPRKRPVADEENPDEEWNQILRDKRRNMPSKTKTQKTKKHKLS